MEKHGISDRAAHLWDEIYKFLSEDQNPTEWSGKINNMYRLYGVQQGDYGPVKIGITVNPKSRLCGLNTGSPIRLRTLFICEHGKWWSEPKGSFPDAEKEIQEHFKTWRMNGEWFYQEEPIAEFVNSTIRHLFDGQWWPGNEIIFKHPGWLK